MTVLTVTPNPAIDWTLQVPGFQSGAVNRVTSQRSMAAGKGVNVAVMLAAYGHRVAATGFLGRENAAAFEDLFARTGIADRFVRIDGATRVGIKIVDEQQTTDVNFAGPAVTASAIEALDQTLARIEGQWVVLAGSLPPGVDASFYATRAKRLRASGCRVVLDASGEPLHHALSASPEVIKPNVHELETLLGISLPTGDAVRVAARSLIERGIGMVVVSMGAAGAMFVDRAQAILAVPPPIEVGSTVGAGDAMVAGIVAGGLDDLPLAELAQLATAFSVATLTRGDADAPTREAIDAIRTRVAVRNAT